MKINYCLSKIVSFKTNLIVIKILKATPDTFQIVYLSLISTILNKSVSVFFTSTKLFCFISKYH